jgi:hypothetical protein
MFALVESGSITKFLNGNRGITLNDLQYPRAIYTLWTEAERNAIGIYSIVYDDTNKKETQWYKNTKQTYTYDASAGTVTATYGTATAKAHADTNFSAQDEEDGLGTEGELNTRGLKYNLIQTVKAQAAGELSKTDWYITRKSEKNTAIPSAITTHRNLVRSRQAAMETAITNASDTPALETLYTYTKDSDGVVSRPLPEMPTL